MLKHFFSLLLALLLATACAQAETADALYLLVTRDAEGVETPVGSAVLYKDQSTLLTSMWTMAQLTDELYAVGADGAYIAVNATGEDKEVVSLALASPSAAQPLQPGSAGTTLYALGHNAAQQPVEGEALHLVTMPYDYNATAMLFTAPDSLLPGSALVDEEGKLFGITLGGYGEGVNRYVAMPMAETGLGEQTVSWLTGFTVEAEAGYLHVDWSDCDHTCDKGNCVTGVFYADTQNPYYSYFMEEETSTTIPVAPGRSYQVWVQHAHGDMAKNVQRPAEAAVLATTPAAEAFDRYDYKDSSIYLAAVPITEEKNYINKHIPPMEHVTAETLGDVKAAIYMQVVSSYAVEEPLYSDLYLVLTTPEGYAIGYAAEFVFEPSLQERDEWNVEIYSMLDDYLAYNDTGAFAPGEYTLCYYLDGALANQLSWVLE